MSTEHARGFSLLEVVVTLVLLSVAVLAIIGLVAQIGGRSAAPVLHTQALYLAEGYLEEALLKRYSDPDGIDEGCAASRTLWDDIGDFNCLATPAEPTDPLGNSLPGLSRYRIQASVGPPSVVGGATTRRVEIRVTHLDGDIDLRLAGLRADY
ncbi:prepilin-type N-terminal cleavage/methylation domain-containing protein [Silanimonas sp.]|uniref:prepilin-type N-terminal cleavage/methylation domain-containing protein n=1 Tax=Silanimonas sp. TaxID=1929290 RepID=UPI001BC2813A|nr:prepilin-type N-terminal cleavage/methylation domain-containing protein [Silanimonas sp.]MBS3896310.1 prepilin-type N-terminal cleavage/methylation domain-containing protein [Silanimonas sp.]